MNICLVRKAAILKKHLTNRMVDCDETLSLTREWLKHRNLDVETNVSALQACGGYCNCEIVFNVRSRWADYLEEHAE